LCGEKMFTGLIEEIGTVIQAKATGDSRRIGIRANIATEGVRLGDSIAVSGVCLTVTELRGPAFYADVSPETVKRSVLGRLMPGDRVNLERALKVGDRLGGHLVTGHIDTVGTLLQLKPEGPFTTYRFSIPETYSNYIVIKGSIAIDGISLTVADCDESGFTVAVIPHTARNTTLQFKKAGDQVNLEFDLLGKYVAKMLSAQSPVRSTPAKKELTLEDLIKAGY